MRKSVEIKTNPEVLKALRDTSGYSVEEVSKKLKTTESKIKETEKGLASFTLTQIKKLADIYERPFFINQSHATLEERCLPERCVSYNLGEIRKYDKKRRTYFSFRSL